MSKSKKKNRSKQRELEARRRKNRLKEKKRRFALTEAQRTPAPVHPAPELEIAILKPEPTAVQDTAEMPKVPEATASETTISPESCEPAAEPVLQPETQAREKKCRRKKQDGKVRWAWRSKPWAWCLLCILAPMAILLCCQLVTLQSMEDTLAWMGSHPDALWFTYALLLAAVVLFSSLLGSLFFAVLLTGVPTVIVAFISYYKEVVNGVPLLISDIAMANRVGDVAGFLKPGMDLGEGTYQAIWILCGALLLIALFGHQTKKQRRHWYRRTVAGLTALLVLLCSYDLEWSTDFLSGPEEEFQAERNERLGLLGGLYSGILASEVEKPDTYNENSMNGILVKARLQAKANPAQKPEKQPNVILLMSESFCDPTLVLPGIDFQDDPIPNYRALAAQWPSGEFLSNTYAGGTGNVEMEVMTGIPIAYLAEDEDLTSLQEEDVYKRLPSIIKAFAGAGYATEFIHSYTNRLYNREENFPDIGFEKVLFEDAFPEDAPRTGPYLSDMALTEMMIREFENRDNDKPLLLYGLSVENHQPYYLEKFSEPSGVRFTTDLLDEQQQESVDSLIYGIRDADAALGALLEYFEECDEPVLVIFWGDHLPGLSMDKENTIYSLLGYSSTADTKSWSPEELKQMHTTCFLVWNNYGAELDIPDSVSTLEMGTGILDWAGVEKPLYFHWVDTALKDMRLYRQRLFVTGNDTPYYAPRKDSKEKDTSDTYRTLVYDILYGDGYIAGEMTAVPGAGKKP